MRVGEGSGEVAARERNSGDASGARQHAGSSQCWLFASSIVNRSRLVFLGRLRPVAHARAPLQEQPRGAGATAARCRTAEAEGRKREAARTRHHLGRERWQGIIYADVIEHVCCAVDVCFDVADGRLDAAGRAEVEGGTAKQRAAPR